MFRNFDEMKDYVKQGRRGRVVIAAAQTDSVLDAAILAAQEDLADCILVGDAGAIRKLLETMAPARCLPLSHRHRDDLVKAAGPALPL
jgi:phosphotransacetylase